MQVLVTSKVGWNLIITTLLFAFIHGITVDNRLSVVIDPTSLIFTGISEPIQEVSYLLSYCTTVLI
ncbi:hypothetical protein [Gracilibacillus lacisalsi]|uniref:hypothetical protein n=1 Tax=Gracilibacillus lacisalsi TaxID=393087 RepID=UPI0012E9A87C|nr:hypothetical protein [Gracilibacillus lacisalsi]